MKNPLFFLTLLVLASPTVRAHESGEAHPHPKPAVSVQTPAPAPAPAPVEDHDHDHDGKQDHDQAHHHEAEDDHGTAHEKGSHDDHGHDGAEPWARQIVIGSVRRDTTALAYGFVVLGAYIAGTRTRRRREGGQR